MPLFLLLFSALMLPLVEAVESQATRDLRGARDPASYIQTLSAVGNQDLRGIWGNGSTIYIADISDNRVFAYNRFNEFH